MLAGAYDIGAGWVNVGVAGNSYVPVSLLYCPSGGAALGNGAERVALGEGEGGGRELAGYSRAREFEPSLAPLPAATWADGHLVLSYLRAKPNPGWVYVIESSADLEVWEPTDGQIEERVSEVDATAERVEAVYLVPMDQAPQRFLRLRVVPLGE